jgi:hypothetical protein
MSGRLLFRLDFAQQESGTDTGPAAVGNGVEGLKVEPGLQPPPRLWLTGRTGLLNAGPEPKSRILKTRPEAAFHLGATKREQAR